MQQLQIAAGGPGTWHPRAGARQLGYLLLASAHEKRDWNDSKKPHTGTSVKTPRRPHRHPLWKLPGFFPLTSRSPCEPALGVCVCRDTLHDKRRSEDKERSHTDSRALILSLPSQPPFLPVPLHPDTISTHRTEPLVIWEVA